MKITTSSKVLGMALAATLVGAIVPAHAEGGAETAGERFVYVPHKSGYPLNFYFVPNERAEFARVEVDAERRGPRVLPSPKSGHPFLTLD